MRRVEQHVISRSHAKWDEIDQMANALEKPVESRQLPYSPSLHF
ncbi:MAG TPA: hypothetical protein VNW73_09530 [Ktedonobacteraceae bacterium]|nr:hypothetical protein [Ktedonobacteraceae bacterium]